MTQSAQDTRTGSYDRAFFSRRQQNVCDSTQVLVPILWDMFHPRSVVDVGCGRGAWLRALLAAGVDRVLGIDGDYVDQSDLDIKSDAFLARDITQLTFKDINARFDLALCLEVAEHLPATAADDLIELLTALSSIVVFSAAVPGQRGTGHINCQWPPYWIERFRSRGYDCVDAIRPRIWQSANVASWYQQNIYVFAPLDVIELNPALASARRDVLSYPTLIDPRKLWKNPDVRSASRELWRALGRAIRRRLSRVVSSF